MGMNVFVGLRYAVWSDGDPDEIASRVNALIARGIAAEPE